MFELAWRKDENLFTHSDQAGRVSGNLYGKTEKGVYYGPLTVGEHILPIPKRRSELV
jgi:hypothetical protein